MTHSLRVLHIASGDLWAGAEAQAFTLMSHLARTPGNEVAAVLLNDGRLAAKLRSAGIDVRIVDERRTGAAGIVLRLRHNLQQWRPDVVHTHRIKENILGSIANRLSRNVPCVRTTHGGSERRPRRGVRGAVNQAVFALDHWCGSVLQRKIVAVSDTLGQVLVEQFGQDKVIVIENGVDADAVRADRGIADFRTVDPDAAHIGLIGRLVDVKRVDLFIGMAALLNADRPTRQFRFHVFGDGPLRPMLVELARRLQVAELINFHGHRDDIATCLGGLNVLVNCSDHEGMPMTALEASALGVPLVAHAVGGLTRVVPEEFLVHRHDASGYKEGVLRALRADARPIAMRKAVSTLETYSAQKNAERMRALYVHLIGRMIAGESDRCG